MSLIRFRTAFRILPMLSLGLTACSTTQIVEENKPLPVVPEYVKVPHPAGFDLADLRAILVNPMAPKGVTGEFADTCDEDFQKLIEATPQKEEREKGAKELVTTEPERMHWCFYAKIARLQEVLQSDSTWSVRQKKVLESFAFLSPIANAFLETYHESRYLRWAAQYYSKVSEWVFFKKLAPTPESSLLYTTGTRPELEPWIGVQRENSKPESVFAKYGISFQPTVAGAVNPFETETSRAPASITPTATTPAAITPPVETSLKPIVEHDSFLDDPTPWLTPPAAPAKH